MNLSELAWLCFPRPDPNPTAQDILMCEWLDSLLLRELAMQAAFARE